MTLENLSSEPVPANHPIQPLPQNYYPWMMEGSVAEGASMADYLRAIKKGFWKLLLLAILGGGLALFYGLWATPKYQATSAIMMISSSGSGGLAALASQVSSIPLVGSQLAGLGGNQKSTQVMGLLKSRSLTEKIVREFDLPRVVFSKLWNPETKQWKIGFLDRFEMRGVQNLSIEDWMFEKTVEQFQKKGFLVEEDKKSGLVKISIELKNPALAVKVNQRILLELQDFINKNSLTVAKRNRIFIEQQLQKNKIELLESGRKLNQFYGSDRVSNTQAEMDVNIGKSPESVKNTGELGSDPAELLREKQALESQISQAERDGIVRKVPLQIYLQYLTLQRELLGKVNGLLTQQYEAAKIEEAKEDLSFQIIDRPQVPVRPSSPDKLLLFGVGIGGGLLLGVLWALLTFELKKS